MILALAAAVAISATCNWADRGLNPYMGDLPTAVDTYTQIPKDVRETLKAKMRARQFDDTAHITATGIRSEGWNYGPLRMMHFGNGSRLCGVVNTSSWPANDPGERALIYTVGKWSIAVPSVCRNVSLITRGPRRAPPPYIALEEPPAEVDPLPVFAVAPIPPITVPGIPDVPTTFSDQGQPPPVPRDAYPEPVSVRQEFFDPWSRPIFGPVSRLFVTADLPVQAPLVPLPPMQTPQTLLPPMPPVPGVVPPAPVDLPDRPGDAVAPVPELSTWALMLGGLLGVWMMTRRRI